jgi:hypothetical protein
MRESTKQMEDQYKSLVQNIVASGSWDNPATGKPWVPKKDFLDPVDDVIQQMEDQLTGQKDENSGIMDTHTQAIVTCNSNLDSSIANAISGLKQTMVNDRGTHSACRTNEDTEIDDMELKCNAFHNADRCDVKHQQDWYSAAAGAGAGGAGTLKDVIHKAKGCRTSIATLESRANTCDNFQTNFQASWCAYASALDDACETHNSCYTTNKNNWNLAQGTITQLESEQKIVYRMLGRIRCYLRLLFRKSNNEGTPTQADIAACQDATVTDTPLDVTYGQIAAPAKCADADAVKDEPTSPTPDTDAWYTREYSKERGVTSRVAQGCAERESGQHNRSGKSGYS